MRKKRIAFIGVGVLGLRGQKPTMPPLIKLLNNLSSVYDITVYRLSFGDVQKQKFKVRSLPFSMLGEKINLMVMILLFAFDHILKRYAVINALSVRPAGRFATIVGKVFDLPVVLHLHAAELIAIHDHNYGDILDSQSKRLTEQLCKKVDLITVLSKFQEETVTGNVSLYVPVEIINHGCDTAHFSFEPKKVGTPLRILFIGYDEPVKAPLAALKVFAMIAGKIDSRLTMIGKGLSEDRFKSENVSLQNVTFTQGMTHGELKDIYHSHDVLLVTSFYESQSAVAIEAMACGVLVCGTHVGVLADHSGTASLTVPVGEYELLAHAITDLTNDIERQNEMRKQGRQWAEAHDHNWTATQYSRIFESIKQSK